MQIPFGIAAEMIDSKKVEILYANQREKCNQILEPVWKILLNLATIALRTPPYQI